MSFGIQVSDHTPRKLYHAGDTFSDVLEVNGPIKDKNIVITLEFHGTSQVRVYFGRDSLFDTAKLFSRKHELFSGPLSLGKGAQKNWPFDFVFPDRTEIEREYQARRTFAGEAHELPPTLSVAGWRCGGSIWYELFARAHKSTFFSIDVRKRERLQFSRRHPEGLVPRSLCHWSKDAAMKLPGPEVVLRSEPAFVSWLKNCCYSDREGIHLTMRVFIPSGMKFEKSASIYVQLQPNDGSAIGETVPPVRLLSIRHTIKARTWFRVPMGRSWDLVKHKSKKICFEAKNEGIELPSGTLTDVGANLGLVLRGGLQPPTFKSYNASHDYRSTTVLQVCCG